jgi:hypothetical protein
LMNLIGAGTDGYALDNRRRKPLPSSLAPKPLRHEVSALEGADLLLQSTEFVIAEVSIAMRFEDGYKFEELINLMSKNGFTVFSFLHIEQEENEMRPRFADIVFGRK